ncbi:DUF4124 domain-containing protein [Chitinibacter fontanus]|uniref:DUF4124 domain-containing protein n=1 Tax=Chitinibacter fontanus TaxID=1737446 RepID=A0A7D5VB00_9NEIS|nr:DUF4124 domain-containing protein [Chitinibacter fontanus]QLI82398.1 DUF4124 domain-containing protein [Chitinibacter fontanus]
MKKQALLLLAMVYAATATAGKVYQWRDADGRVYYSDQPPPQVVAKERQIRPNTIGNASQAQSKASKVAAEDEIVLWVSANCEPACSQALAILDQRNVRYEVKNADPSNEKSMLGFFNAAGTMQARPPILIIGKNVLKEWNSPVWQAELSKAGYPLPKAKQ